MIKFVLLARNKEKTKYEVRRHFNILNLIHIPFGKTYIMYTSEITSKITKGYKFIILTEGDTTKIFTYQTQNGKFIRSHSNNTPGDNIEMLPVKDI